jgi:hypothetical protein
LIKDIFCCLLCSKYIPPHHTLSYEPLGSPPVCVTLARTTPRATEVQADGPADCGEYYAPGARDDADAGYHAHGRACGRAGLSFVHSVLEPERVRGDAVGVEDVGGVLARAAAGGQGCV